MKKILILSILFVGSAIHVNAQKTISIADTIQGWYGYGKVGMNVNQASFVNWAGGGQNTIAATWLFDYNWQYRDDKLSWINTLNLAFGLSNIEDVGARKTDDNINFSSALNHQFAKSWYYTTLLQFNTQFAPGYDYPNDSLLLSNFMAPGYLTLSLGIEYKPNDAFQVMFSPLTAKFTFVLNDSLSAEGQYGVTPGDKVRSEFGAFLKAQFQKDIWENVTFKSRLELFSNYLNNPQNIDVFWENVLNMKINKWLSTNVSATLKYDDDILIPDKETGELAPRVQFKEILAIGLALKF